MLAEQSLHLPDGYPDHRRQFFGRKRLLYVLLHDLDNGQQFLGLRGKLEFSHDLLFVAMAANTVMHELQGYVIGKFVAMRL